MFDKDAFPGMILLCVWLAVSWGRGHGQDHGCADLHLDMEEVVPDVFEIHVLQRATKIERTMTDVSKDKELFCIEKQCMVECWRSYKY